MDNKITTEEFNSTKIKMEDISDESEDCVFVSKCESEIPGISLPRMQEVCEGIVSFTSASNVESSIDRGDEQEIVSRHYQESEQELKMDEEKLSLHEQEENEKLKSGMDKAMRYKSSQHERKREYEEVRSGIDEFEQYELQYDKNSKRIRREMEDMLKDLSRWEQETKKFKRKIKRVNRRYELIKRESKRLQRVNEMMDEYEKYERDIEKKYELLYDDERLCRERDEVFQNISLYIQEINTIRRETERMNAEMEEDKKPRIERVKREMEEDIQDIKNKIPVLDEKERTNGILTWHGPHPERMKYCATNFQKECMNEICEEESKPNQDNKFTSSAAVCSKFETGVFKQELLAVEKEEIEDLSNPISWKISHCFKGNPRVEDRYSTETVKVDKWREIKIHA